MAKRDEERGPTSIPGHVTVNCSVKRVRRTPHPKTDVPDVLGAAKVQVVVIGPVTVALLEIIVEIASEGRFRILKDRIGGAGDYPLHRTRSSDGSCGPRTPEPRAMMTARGDETVAELP
ncbi:MAG: hypothetical protein ABFC89_11805 [Methanospirillum sp.]